MSFTIQIACNLHLRFAKQLCQFYENSAKERGTGIALRTIAYIQKKMTTGNAIIAIKANELAGFCYIETWSHDNYVANSGLIINPKFRHQGLGKKIKKRVFNLARDKYPKAKIFGITTSPAVMKINFELGYQPVDFANLTQDEAFWNACSSCLNFDILQRNNRERCLCTGMMAPSKETQLALDLSNQIIQKNEKQ